MGRAVRVAAVQPRLYGEFWDSRNLENAIRLLERAWRLEVDVACLPEYCPWSGEEELVKAAEDLGIYIVAGLIEARGDLRYNTATLISPDGIVGRQRKSCLGAFEREQLGFKPGSAYLVFETPLARIGMPVCIDLWGYPQAGIEMACKGAEVLFNPSYFYVLRDHWKCALLTRAFELYTPIVGANYAEFKLRLGGRWWRSGGKSLIVSPPNWRSEEEAAEWLRRHPYSLDDWVRGELGMEEGILTADLDLDAINTLRQSWMSRFGYSLSSRQKA